MLSMTRSQLDMLITKSYKVRSCYKGNNKYKENIFLEICQLTNKSDSYDKYDPEHTDVCFLFKIIKQFNLTSEDAPINILHNKLFP